MKKRSHRYQRFLIINERLLLLENIGPT